MATPDPNQVLHGRAVTSATADTDFAHLLQEQTDEFFSLVVDMGTILKDATSINVRGPGLDIATMDIPAGRVAGGLGPMVPVPEDDELEPEYGGRLLRPASFDLAWRYEATVLPQVNIEEGAHESTVDRNARVYLGGELNRICLRSNTAGVNPVGYSDGNMTTIDGWQPKALAGGHVYDHGGEYVHSGLFKQMFQTMPYKWRGRADQKADMRFYVNDIVEIEYRDFFSRATTPLGSLSLTQENQLTYAGIPLVAEGDINCDEAGILSQSASADEFSWLLLVQRRNLVVGYGPAMRIFVHPHESGKFIRYNWWGQVDVNYSNIDAVVIGVNVVPEVNPALAVYY